MDRNPLRRRTDRFESALRVALVLAFGVGGPLLAIAVGHVTDADGLAQVRSERAWHQVTAVVTKSAPQSTTPYGAMATIWESGRWTTASGRTKTGYVPVAAGTPVGTKVSVWLNRAGQVTSGQPLTAGVVVLREVVAEILTLVGAALAVFLVAALIRWVLNRRRLARWAIEWALVGPRWTSRR